MTDKVITICASSNFYKHVNEVRETLEANGINVLVPELALVMAKSGDYDVSHYKTWYANDDDYDKKADLMRGHFEEVAKGDIILVFNDEKNGQPNYIGGNVLMEMALAFWLKKPIYLMNDIPEESKFLEEIKGVGSIPLQGDIDRLIKEIEA